MARRRAPKGSHRIDAALDAMGQFGFSRPIVRKTVNNLLKVYGTDEAWIAIEENSYMLLLDKLIEEQVEENKLLKEEEPQKVESHEIAEKIQEEDSETGNSLLTQTGNLQMEEVKSNEVLTERISTEASVSHHLTAAPKRKPSYGWISESEDEEVDFVILTPAKRLR